MKLNDVILSTNTEEMIRKILYTEQEETLTLDLPENLRGKKIEVIAFEIEEEKVPNQTTMGDFFGVLPDEDATQLQQHTQTARSEWERDF